MEQHLVNVLLQHLVSSVCNFFGDDAAEERVQGCLAAEEA